MRRVPDIRDQRGSALFIVVISLPVLIILAAFSMDVARWFVHKRHVQVQADAAALAAANQVVRDIESSGSCSNSGTIARANDYAARNATNGHFYGAGSDIPSGATSVTVNAQPCADAFVKVDTKDAGLKAFFDTVKAPFDVNAHAKVNFVGLRSRSGVFPVAVPTDPTTATAVFTDPANPTDPTKNVTVPLTKTSSGSAGPIYTGTAPSALTVGDQLDLDVKLGATSTFSKVGLVRGYSISARTGQQSPVAADVHLVPSGASCLSEVSAPYFFASGTSCLVGIVADVLWNPDVTAPKVGLQKVTAQVAGVDYPLVYTSGHWTVAAGAATIAVPASGAVPVSLKIEQQDGKVGGTANNDKCPAARACTVTLGTVQRTYNANTDEIVRAEVGEVGGNLSGVTSVLKGSKHTFTVTVAITSSLSLGSGIRAMRISGENQTFAVGCANGNGHFTDAMTSGCPIPFQRNPLTRSPVCPTTVSPPDCVPADPGNKLAAVDKGLTDRITVPGTGCSPNALFPSGDLSAIKDGDKRLISVALVPYDSFSNSGTSTSFPVLDFAWFYITGWTDNQGNKTACGAATNQYPAGFVLPSSSIYKAYIFGRYVKRIDDVTSGGSGDPSTPCNFNTVSGCVAVMTE